MTNLDWLTHADFAPLVGTHFDVSVDDGPGVAMELAEATERELPGGRGPTGEQRQQFSLLFRGPADLPQGTYRVTHGGLGEVHLFLVPLGPDAEGPRYEAAFA